MPFSRNVPTATVQLDKPRTIALTLDALNRFEEITGQPLMEIELDAKQIVKQIDVWIWSALDDPDRAEISQADVRGMIHLGNLSKVMNAVTLLITASIPESPEGKTEPAPPIAQRAEAGDKSSISENSGQLESTISA